MLKQLEHILPVYKMPPEVSEGNRKRGKRKKEECAYSRKPSNQFDLPFASVYVVMRTAKKTTSAMKGLKRSVRSVLMPQPTRTSKGMTKRASWTDDG